MHPTWRVGETKLKKCYHCREEQEWTKTQERLE
jgi:hypothetical protein